MADVMLPAGVANDATALYGFLLERGFDVFGVSITPFNTVLHFEDGATSDGLDEALADYQDPPPPDPVMAATLEERIAQLEDMITELLLGGLS